MPSIFVLLLTSCGAGGDSPDPFAQSCLVPGAEAPSTSPFASRWTKEAAPESELAMLFGNLTDGQPVGVQGVTWEGVDAGVVDISLTMTGDLLSEVYRFDESGLTSEDVSAWGLQVAEVPKEWPGCDLEVVSGQINGTYQHGPHSWPLSVEIYDARIGGFMLSFAIATEAYGEVLVDAQLGVARRELVGVTWWDQVGVVLGQTLGPVEAVAED